MDAVAVGKKGLVEYQHAVVNCPACGFRNFDAESVCLMCGEHLAEIIEVAEGEMKEMAGEATEEAEDV